MFNPINLISKFIKSSNQKELDKLAKIVSEVNAYEEKVAKLQNEDFPIKTEEFKKRINKGESLDKILKNIEKNKNEYKGSKNVDRFLETLLAKRKDITS